jgi:hypothetical protein
VTKPFGDNGIDRKNRQVPLFGHPVVLEVFAHMSTMTQPAPTPHLGT